MDNLNRVNRPPATSVVARPQEQRQASPSPKKSGIKKKVGIILAALLLIVLVVTGVVFLRSQTGVSGTIDGSRYQAVFFTNGQVYFGKLKPMSGDYMRLTNIYYLQAKSTDGKENNPQEASAQDASNVQLVKLGSEIHGPDDEMIVNKDQILFFENLKKDSNVSTTISNYQSQKR